MVLVDHGISAVFDDDDFLVIGFDIGEGLNQDLRPLVDGHGFSPYCIRCGSRR